MSVRNRHGVAGSPSPVARSTHTLTGFDPTVPSLTQYGNTTGPGEPPTFPDMNGTIPGSTITPQTITGTEILDGSITTPKLATGAITLVDEWGQSVLTPSGFTGSWSEFISDGLYNSRFSASVAGVLADGRTENLPYWTVSRTGSPTVTVVDAAGWPGGSYVHCTFSAFEDVVVLLSDPVPVTGGQDYAMSLLMAMTDPGQVGGPGVIGSIDWHDAAGGYLSNSGTQLFVVGGPTVPSTTLPDVSKVAPAGSAYARARLTVSQWFEHVAGDVVDVGVVTFKQAAYAVAGSSNLVALALQAAAVSGTSVNVGYSMGIEHNNSQDLVGNVGNFDTNTAAISMVNPTANRNIHGIVEWAGQILHLLNINSVNSITLIHLSASAFDPRYRIACPNNANYVIPPRGAVMLWYESGTGYWRFCS